MTIKCVSTANAIGYRIQYCTSPKFKSGIKAIYSDSETKAIKGLKKGKKYYVKISPYAVYDDGTYTFGQNSLVKKVTIKKR